MSRSDIGTDRVNDGLIEYAILGDVVWAIGKMKVYGLFIEDRRNLDVTHMRPRLHKDSSVIAA